MKNWWDLQSLAYLVLYVVLIVWQWLAGFAWPLFGALLFITVGLQIIHHNHVHLGMWRSKWLNRVTCHVISTLTAIPSAMMYSAHVRNHHVHRHGPDDVTRTYRFGGDHNHLVGYLLHPFQAFAALVPTFCREFVAGWPKRSRFSRDLALQMGLTMVVWIALLLVDWQKCMLLVMLPQAIGWHWLLAANYFQHAHCDDASHSNFARNFTGAINYLWFNIGFHTVHHDHPKAHWSTLRALHEADPQAIDPGLNQKSFALYFTKTFLLSPLVPSLRSASLRTER